MPCDVQDALITVLSEKTLPVPELGQRGAGGAGLQRHRHRQRPRPRRQRAVGALRRRFNTVVLPLPADRRGGGRDRRRAGSPSWASLWSCRRCRPPTRRSAGWSRSSASCAAASTEDGRTRLKVAERHAVDRRGDLGGHQRPGAGRPLRRRPADAADVAAGIVGAVVKDPVARPRRLARVPRGGRARARRLGRLLRRLPRAVSRRERRRSSCSGSATTARVGAIGRARPRRAAARRRAGRAAGRLRGRRCAWVGDEHLVPPVALLGYVVDHRSAAAFWPFAEFSPEWQAIRWAHAARRRRCGRSTCRCSRSLAARRRRRAESSRRTWRRHRRSAGRAGRGRRLRRPRALVGRRHRAPRRRRAGVRRGRRGDDRGARRARRRRRCARRSARRTCARCCAGRSPTGTSGSPWCAAPGTCRRWPSRCRRPRPTPRRCAACRKVKVGMSWVPWTHRRLAAASGYGAGVRSPAGTPTSSTIPANRASPAGSSAPPGCCATAACRRRPTISSPRPAPPTRWPRCATGRCPGLAEVLDAADTVLAGASGMTLIDRELIVGDAIGEVPDDAPQVPLARDLAAQQRTVRLKPAATAQHASSSTCARRTAGPDRVLLHRLRALGVPGARSRRAAAAAARSARPGGCRGSRS